jgi:hypothetical protein
MKRTEGLVVTVPYQADDNLIEELFTE